MLTNITPTVTLPTKDLNSAQLFYQEIIGLSEVRKGPGEVLLSSGDGYVLLYASTFAGTNKATSCAWSVPNFDEEVERLRRAGVEFLVFEIEEVEWVDGVAHLPDNIRIVWFKDPDGNILAVETRPN